MKRQSRSRRNPNVLRHLLWGSLWAILFLVPAPEAHAFCGFYVGKADASLYNEASQVVLVRDGSRTVIGMMNDFKGDLKEFALVVPVPVVLEEGQIHVGRKELFDRVDAYSAPRLVEYFDEDPCRRYVMGDADGGIPVAGGVLAERANVAPRSLGVTIEARYTVGEYDILILSARDSAGLETWLLRNGYRIPKGAHQALQPYIRRNMKFFVAKVNLEEQAKTGVSYLRPLQFAFDSEKFMLPIRLGMVNAKGPQDLLIYALTRKGRVETTNYRTVKLPTGMDLPEYVKDRFPDFYRAMFGRQVEREEGRAVFTEYVWNMAWCDPCSAPPLTPEELRGLGVFWEPAQAMLTRLHVRYAAGTFPEDLVFQETQDQQSFQGRYVLRHAWKGDAGQCAEAGRYFEELRRRREEEAQTLARLTGWDIDQVRAKVGVETPQRWWQSLWR
jgi:hypothetical protein